MVTFKCKRILIKKKKNIELIHCEFKGPNKPGDFKFEIEEELQNPKNKGQRTLWIFNDNHDHRKTYYEGTGNAVIRPYNKYGRYKKNPLSAGITTGTTDPYEGYNSLDTVTQPDQRSARTNIDEDMENIKNLLKTGNYNKVKIITNKQGLIGSQRFNINTNIKKYIKTELDKIIKELNDTLSNNSIIKKAVVFDFDKCLMEKHWWSTYKNNSINTINPKKEDFAHKDIEEIFHKCIDTENITLAVASFGRKDVIKKALLNLLGNKSEKIYVTTPSDYDGNQDGRSMGSKNIQLENIAGKYNIKPENIIFFDDDNNNIKEATKIGINAIKTAPFQTQEHKQLVYDFINNKIDNAKLGNLTKKKKYKKKKKKL